MRGAATGPLTGLTVVVKDMYDIAGARTGGGSPDWLAEQKSAARHAAVVEQIIAAGATITGKTICDEFFYSIAGRECPLRYASQFTRSWPATRPGSCNQRAVLATFTA